MCQSFTDKMAEEKNLLIEARDELPNTSVPTDASDVKKGNGSNGNKRAASENLEQNVTKAAKLTSSEDDDIKSETEVNEEPDPRDKEIAKLMKIKQEHRATIAQLEQRLEDVEDELDEESCRRAALEARETKRIEKEKLAETDIHATMKLATKNLRAQLNTGYQQKEKDLKESFKDKLADNVARIEKKSEKKLQDATTKAQNREKELLDKIKKINADHKQEVKELNEDKKEALKELRPEHSQAMKGKAKELKAKDKRIADLVKATEELDALNAEKETLATELEKAKTKIKDLRQVHKTMEADKADMQGQYNHKLEHEARRWKIQNDIAEDAKAKLMIQQRSNFALRQEGSVKNNRIQALQQQLQATQQQHHVYTADVAVQSNIPTTDASIQTSSNINKTNGTLDSNDIASALGLSSYSTPSSTSTPSSEHIETETGLDRVE